VVDVGQLPLLPSLARPLGTSKLLLPVEEGTTHGGLGSAVLEAVSMSAHPPRVRLVGLPDQFVRHGEARAQRTELGLDAEGLRRIALEALRA
jgi:1-deoxy-D-xylulose-5-phosphate synthase